MANHSQNFPSGDTNIYGPCPNQVFNQSDFCKSWRSQIVVECQSSLQLVRPCPKRKRGNTIFIACLDLIGGTHLIKRSTLFSSGVYLSTSAGREAESSANLEPNGTGTLKFTTTKSADPLSGLTQRFRCDMTRTGRMMDLIHFTTVQRTDDSDSKQNRVWGALPTWYTWGIFFCNVGLT